MVFVYFIQKTVREKNKFDKELKRKFEEYDKDDSKDYDFSCYVFPNSIKIKDYKNKFKGENHFTWTEFRGDSWFGKTQFEGKTDFTEVTFERETDLF